MFNNYIDGGMRKVDFTTGNYTYTYGKEKFDAAKQTKDLLCEFYSEGDSKLYDYLLNGNFGQKLKMLIMAKIKLS